MHGLTGEHRGDLIEQRGTGRHGQAGKKGSAGSSHPEDHDEGEPYEPVQGRGRRVGGGEGKEAQHDPADPGDPRRDREDEDPVAIRPDTRCHRRGRRAAHSEGRVPGRRTGEQPDDPGDQPKDAEEEENLVVEVGEVEVPPKQVEGGAPDGPAGLAVPDRLGVEGNQAEEQADRQ